MTFSRGAGPLTWKSRYGAMAGLSGNNTALGVKREDSVEGGEALRRRSK